MKETDNYDILVLGSGVAGKVLAWTSASEGKRTAVIERKFIGGACPNVACLPTKNVIHTAKVFSLFRRHKEFGIDTGQLTLDMAGVYARKRNMVNDLVQVHLDRYHKSGAELILGDGRFIAPRTVQVTLKDGTERTITGERVFINVGTHASVPDVPGLAAARPLTHVEALDLQRLPKHLIVLGAGFVGLEFAQAIRRLGSRVTLISRRAQLAPREDADVAESILQLFSDEGIEVFLRSNVMSVEGLSGDKVDLHLKTDHGMQTVKGTDILVALGRTPNTSGIGLELAGIAVTPNGHIHVNDRLETTAQNTWAMGECAGSPYFTHASADDFEIVHENLNGGHRSTNDRLIPFCIFTDPPLARVGINEIEAEERGIAYRTASLPMAAVLRTRTLSEPRGFMKTLVDTKSDRILGFTAFGSEAGELMSAVQIAMLSGQPYTILREAIFAHPTMSEGLKSLFSGVQTLSANHFESPVLARASAQSET